MADDRLKPDGRLWVARGSEEITLKTFRIDEGPPTTFRWEYVLETAHQKTPIDYVRLFFPMPILESITQLTSGEIRRHGGKVLSADEFWKYLGLRILMSIDVLPEVADYWHDSDTDSAIVPRAFGRRFGMSKNRFEEIDRHLKFGTEVEVRFSVLFTDCLLSCGFAYVFS